jgi:hypothetical protein
VLRWGDWSQGTSGTVLAALFLTLFLGHATAMFGAHVFRKPKVDREAIFGICCVYLLIGAVFASAFHVVFALDPGSLSLSADSTARESFASTLYLSFVTLTTLGYGDLLPPASSARNHPGLEAESSRPRGGIVPRLSQRKQEFSDGDATRDAEGH